MFSLMDRVERGIDEMLRYLEEHIKQQGLADMIAAADIITSVSGALFDNFQVTLTFSSLLLILFCRDRYWLYSNFHCILNILYTRNQTYLTCLRLSYDNVKLVKWPLLES